MKRRDQIIAALLVVQGLFVLVWWWGGATEPTGDEVPPPGTVVERRWEEPLSGRAPELSYETYDGTQGRLDDHRGDETLVHFWGTWCPPCVDELPKLLRYTRENNVDLVAVAVDDDRESLQTFFKSRVPEDVVLADPNTSQAFGVTRLPQTIIVDPSGDWTKRLVGPREWTSDDPPHE